MEVDEAELVRLLRKGDTEAFASVVTRHHASMLRVASTFVATRSDAEDVVQETWLAVIRGLRAFEGRSSLRSWIFAILINRARSHGAREAKGPGAALRLDAAEGPDGAVPADRFIGRPGHGAWREPLTPWPDDPQLRLDSAETMQVIMAAVADLPPLRRQVLVLRDVEGWSSPEVVALLGISEGNQRVLLHRARGVLRARLETLRLPKERDR